jgi:hypothetical protein
LQFVVKEDAGALSCLDQKGSLDMKNSSDSALLPPKPTGLRKWVYALPHHFYALHLGWLFDHKFLLLITKNTELKNRTFNNIPLDHLTTRHLQTIMVHL